MYFPSSLSKFSKRAHLSSATFIDDAKNCYWFSTLVSKQSNLKKTYKLIDRTGAYFVKTISMGTGNKSSRIVAWTFQSKDAQNKWREERWQ